jgi:hypothetical protein
MMRRAIDTNSSQESDYHDVVYRYPNSSRRSLLRRDNNVVQTTKEHSSFEGNKFHQNGPIAWISDCLENTTTPVMSCVYDDTPLRSDKKDISRSFLADVKTDGTRQGKMRVRMSSTSATSYPEATEEITKTTRRKVEKKPPVSLGKLSHPASLPSLHLAKSQLDFNSTEAQMTSLSPFQELSQASLTTSESGDESVAKDNSGMGEARIVAPNVERLSPASSVEIRLQSEVDCVAVLCSVDILKMRSQFFYEVLGEQEHNYSPSKYEVWRCPITIPEAAPFEAASFLEFLHMAKQRNKTAEWNFAWCRLSVNWLVEDIITEFAFQIENHTTHLITLIRKANWRCSPDVYVGARAAIFPPNQKSLANDRPFILHGSIIKGAPSTDYGSLRVSLDHGKEGASATCEEEMLVVEPQAKDNNSSKASENLSEMDVKMPFWVQIAPGDPWVDPDELFTQQIDALISSMDKEIFWEMTRSMIEMPQLCICMLGGLKSLEDIEAILARREYRPLWTTAGPDCLPISSSSNLLRQAYTSQQ